MKSSRGKGRKLLSAWVAVSLGFGYRLKSNFSAHHLCSLWESISGQNLNTFRERVREVRGGGWHATQLCIHKCKQSSKRPCKVRFFALRRRRRRRRSKCWNPSGQKFTMARICRQYNVAESANGKCQSVGRQRWLHLHFGKTTNELALSPKKKRSSNKFVL